MKALVGVFNQEKALVGAFSVIVHPVVEPMEHYTALVFSVQCFSCDKYWACDEGVAELRTCGNGLAFIDTDEVRLSFVLTLILSGDR